MSEVPINVITPSTSQSRAASMSSFFVLDKEMIWALRPSEVMAFTDSCSFLETIGKPASICLILTSSNFLAISNFSSGLKQTPGVCSPSLKVVS